MTDWTSKQVSDWLKANGFRKHVKLFKDKNIEGNTLLGLTDDDIPRLLVEVQDDGTVHEARIGVISRFRMKLMQLKTENIQGKNDKRSDVSSTTVPPNIVDPSDSNKGQHERNLVTKSVKKKGEENPISEVAYLIDDYIQCQFLQKPKFPSYFITYIKQETSSIDVQIQEMRSSDIDQPSFTYNVKLIGTKQECRTVRDCMKRLLASITNTTYTCNQIKNWFPKSKSSAIVQNILDKESHLFTVCQLNGRIVQTLRIYYFDDEKFNSSVALPQIDDTVQNKILQRNVHCWPTDTLEDVEVIDIDTNQISWKYQVCPTEQYHKELDQLKKQYENDDSLLYIRVTPNDQKAERLKRVIEIFGHEQLVHEALQRFQTLFDRHQLRNYQFDQLSSTELDCLMNLCSAEVSNLEKEYRRRARVPLHIEQNQFYAPQHLENEIQSRLKAILASLKTNTFQTIEFYYDMPEKLSSSLKQIAEKNFCSCEIKVKTRSKFYPIPKANEKSPNISKTIIDQSNLFASSSSVFCQASLTNGSVEVHIGDIALQKVDAIIIPSTSFGLKESLIERAGQIVQQQSSSKEEKIRNTIPLITETTGGNLKCQKLLFVNWSVSTNDDYSSESVQFFISRSFEYIRTLNIQSIAFAVPDWCDRETILAEEMLEETINQINQSKSSSWKVSFILLPSQQSLYDQFANTIQEIQKKDDSYGNFRCAVLTMKITLRSHSNASMIRCEDMIKTHLQRSIIKMRLGALKGWDQCTINAFYQYSSDRYVLPKMNDQQQIDLFGHINHVYDVQQKYQLTNQSIQLKRDLSSARHCVVISYSLNDVKIAHLLTNRLVDDGFSVWRTSDASKERSQTFKKMKKCVCIILCMSKTYFQDELCQKEATYGKKIGKYIIPVEVENDQSIECLHRLVKEESHFQFFGSKKQMDSEYDKLLLRILQCAKIGHVPSRKRTPVQFSTPRSNNSNHTFTYFLLAPKRNLLQYEEKVKEIIKLRKEQITDDNKKDLMDIVRDIWLDFNVFSYKQWLYRVAHTKKSLSTLPFTFSGDNNETLFSIFDGLFKNSDLVSDIQKFYRKRTFYIPSPKGSSTPSIIHSRTSTPEEGAEKDLSTVKTNSARSSIVSRSSSKIHSKRNKADDHVQNDKKRQSITFNPTSKTSLQSESKILQFRFKFIEQMQKNMDEFEKFCQEYESSSQCQPRTEKSTHVYPTAIFTPSPFSPNIKFELRKTRCVQTKTDLPLKFPWNGVFDAEKPVAKWHEPSVFFSFEAKKRTQRS